MSIPALIHAGDTVKWSEPAVPDYPSASWTRTVALRHATDADAVNVVGVANAAGGWDFTIPASQSKALGVGAIYWHDLVTSGGERFTLGTGTIQVKPNIAGTGTTFDGRLQSEIDLEAVKAEIRARVTGGSVQEYSIGNRSLKKMPLPDLIALESKLKVDVVIDRRAQKLAQGAGSGRSVYVRFGGN